MKQGLASPAAVINLKDVEDLKGIRRLKDGAIFIGALTRITELLESPVIHKKYPGLWKAAEAVSAPPLQNMGTVGGNIAQETRCLYYNQTLTWRKSKPVCFKAGGTVCNAVKGGKHCFAVYQGDLAPMLIALSAQVILSKKEGSRTIPLEDLYTGKGKVPLAMGKDELLEGVILTSPGKNMACHYEKLRLRQAMDYPLVGVAVCISGAFVVILRGRLGALFAMTFARGDLMMVCAVAIYALYSALSVKETEVRASEMRLKQESSKTEDLPSSDHLKQSEHSETEEQEQQVEMSVEKKIMLLSQEGKTDQEIAKLLGIGTGEVRLVLSLFAGKNHYSSDSAI